MKNEFCTIDVAAFDFFKFKKTNELHFFKINPTAQAKFFY